MLSCWVVLTAYQGLGGILCTKSDAQLAMQQQVTPAFQQQLCGQLLQVCLLMYMAYLCPKENLDMWDRLA